MAHVIRVHAGDLTVRGVSVAGVYTALQVPELHAVFDVGIAPRSFAGTESIFLSHGHADHIGALGSLLGIRGMLQAPPPKVFMPAAIAETVGEMLRVTSRMQRYELAIEPIPMSAGEERHLKADLWVRAFRTHHPVPSLGYQLVRKVEKLRPEFHELPGAEIGRRRKAGEDLFYVEERPELAYATDTLVRVLDTHPSLLRTRVLILECSFLDDRKSLADSRAGGHVHLDELLSYADHFENEHLVLMHLSQLYSPREARDIIRTRCPARLLERVSVLAPEKGDWFG